MIIPSPRAKRHARIEIIPLIDIIFFLLATFMIVSLSMIKNQGLNVHLPVAVAGTSQDRNQAVTITVSKNGDYTWNKESVAASELTGRLEHLKATEPEAKLFINGDNRVQLQRVVTILDEARKVGLAKVDSNRGSALMTQLTEELRSWIGWIVSILFHVGVLLIGTAWLIQPARFHVEPGETWISPG